MQPPGTCHRVRDAERAIPRCPHVTNNAHPLADRSKHEIERACAGGAGQRTQDRSGTGLCVSDFVNVENDAQEQRDMDPAVETGMGSHAEEKSQPGTEGLAVNVDRVLRRIGWSWENALEVKTEKGERLHITQCPEC